MSWAPLGRCASCSPLYLSVRHSVLTGASDGPLRFPKLVWTPGHKDMEGADYIASAVWIEELANPEKGTPGAGKWRLGRDGI